VTPVVYTVHWDAILVGFARLVEIRMWNAEHIQYSLDESNETRVAGDAQRHPARCRQINKASILKRRGRIENHDDELAWITRQVSYDASVEVPCGASATLHG
jgi:hypothetical protein